MDGIIVEIIGDIQKRLNEQTWEEPARIEDYRLGGDSRNVDTCFDHVSWEGCRCPRKSSSFWCRIPRKGGGYEARALGESIFTEGETIEEIKKSIREAVLCHFEAGERPKVVRLHYVRDEVIAI